MAPIADHDTLTALRATLDEMLAVVPMYHDGEDITLALHKKVARLPADTEPDLEALDRMEQRATALVKARPQRPRTLQSDFDTWCIHVRQALGALRWWDLADQIARHPDHEFQSIDDVAAAFDERVTLIREWLPRLDEMIAATTRSPS